jgi:uncharacterized membrane protein
MPLNRDQAQQRADDIQAFVRELARLEQEQALHLTSPQRTQLATHHGQLLAQYRQQFDIDHNPHARQLSLGMRIASLLGALALAASVLFLFHQFWGYFSSTAQSAILAGSATGSLLLTVAVRQRDAAGYFSKMAAMLAFACLVLNTLMLGDLFNITPSAQALLAWAAFGLLLAYYTEARLLLACGLLCLLGFIAARVGNWSGMYWLDAADRPEHLLPAGLLLLAWPSLLCQQRFPGFAATYRVIGLLALLIPVLVLGHWGESSYLPWPADLSEGLYQVLGFLLSALCIGLGSRRGWAEVVNTGLGFFILLLFIKVFDWWWEVIPTYLFFLILSLMAVLTLLILRRLRAADGTGGGLTHEI